MKQMSVPLTIEFPSGDVSQWFEQYNSMFNGNQFGLVNINVGQSKAPEVERQILDDVGSYGRQLGRIGDAMAVLMKHFHPKEALKEDEQIALDNLKYMLREIEAIKEAHGR